MKNRLVSVVLAGALMGPLGFLVGRAFPAQAGADEELHRLVREQGAQLAALRRVAAPAPQGQCTVVAALGSAEGAALRAELARIIRDELRGGKAEVAAQAPTKAAPDEASSESVAATADAHRLIESAMGARRWTDREAEAMRQLMPAMTDAQRDEITHRLLAAINTQALKLDVAGPPF